ncbi:zinc finger CCCH domain-containing protein 17-like [Folsomia candida]|uniref:Zinc finger CCCH domain-containing protein 17 n=1 Tax=Folsomia candida TaxID=158441 RepID=A0A226EQ88_FOLCA|nr:zinc finger CCCH domain-containing protein 17-like [Folsomia candida]OXA59317.1 Zinc finger CCCH domain-containing protein 17 [Folsomia candida]
MTLKLVSKVSSEHLVSGEDWECLMWLNGKLYSAGYASGKIKVWSPDLQQVLKEWPAHEYPIYHMCPGPPPTFFTSSSDCTIKQWEEGENGDFVLIATLEGHEEPARKLRFDSDKKRLYSGDELGKVLIWEDGKLIGILETLEEIWDMMIYNDLLFTARHLDVVINTLSQRGDQIRHSVKNTIPGKGPFLITKGEKLCFADRSNFQIHVNEAFKSGNANLAKLEGHESIVNGIASHNDTLYTSGSDKKLIAWNLTTLSRIESLNLDGYVNDIVISDSDGTIYAGGQDNNIFAVKLT